MPLTLAHGARRRTPVLRGLYSLECSLFVDDRRRLLTQSPPSAEQSGE